MYHGTEDIMSFDDVRDHDRSQQTGIYNNVIGV